MQVECVMCVGQVSAEYARPGCEYGDHMMSVMCEGVNLGVVCDVKNFP